MSDTRITEEQIDRLLSTAEYTVYTEFRKCTIVSAKLENGYTLTESTGCVDEKDYDQPIRIELCKRKIRKRLQELEEYALQKEVTEKQK